jgi:hypothetical protein
LVQTRNPKPSGVTAAAPSLDAVWLARSVRTPTRGFAPTERQADLGDPGGPGRRARRDQWGTSTDGQRIYAAISNGSHKTYLHHLRRAEEDHDRWPMDGARPGHPQDFVADRRAGGPEYITDGFVSSANGVVYAGSSGRDFYAWTQRPVGSRGASRAAAQYGRAIMDGVVYRGSGYNTEAREMPVTATTTSSPPSRWAASDNATCLARRRNPSGPLGKFRQRWP